MLRNHTDLIEHVSARDRADFERCLYRDTECGAWIDWGEGYVRVGSIVEGCDFGTTIYRLAYPFTAQLYSRCIEAVEAEADALWKWANHEEGDLDGIEPPNAWADFPDLQEYRDGISS